MSAVGDAAGHRRTVATTRARAVGLVRRRAAAHRRLVQRGHRHPQPDRRAGPGARARVSALPRRAAGRRAAADLARLGRRRTGPAGYSASARCSTGGMLVDRAAGQRHGVLHDRVRRAARLPVHLPGPQRRRPLARRRCSSPGSPTCCFWGYAGTARCSVLVGDGAAGSREHHGGGARNVGAPVGWPGEPARAAEPPAKSERRRARGRSGSSARRSAPGSPSWAGSGSTARSRRSAAGPAPAWCS